MQIPAFLRLFGLMMLERQIVVTGPRLSVYSDVIMAMPPLLQPYFRWHSMLMPVLPLSLEAFLDAPVPYFAGVPCSHPATDQARVPRPLPAVGCEGGIVGLVAPGC